MYVYTCIISVGKTQRRSNIGEPIAIKSNHKRPVKTYLTWNKHIISPKVKLIIKVSTNHFRIMMREPELCIIPPILKKGILSRAMNTAQQKNSEKIVFLIIRFIFLHLRLNTIIL